MACTAVARLHLPLSSALPLCSLSPSPCLPFPWCGAERRSLPSIIDLSLLPLRGGVAVPHPHSVSDAASVPHPARVLLCAHLAAAVAEAAEPSPLVPTLAHSVMPTSTKKRVSTRSKESYRAAALKAQETKRRKKAQAEAEEEGAGDSDASRAEQKAAPAPSDAREKDEAAVHLGEEKEGRCEEQKQPPLPSPSPPLPDLPDPQSLLTAPIAVADALPADVVPSPRDVTGVLSGATVERGTPTVHPLDAVIQTTAPTTVAGVPEAALLPGVREDIVDKA